MRCTGRVTASDSIVLTYPAAPTVTFPRHRIALFVHGCFWHWHGCKRSRTPKTNVEYWTAKIERNVNRDAQTRSELGRLGWKWQVIWECDISTGVISVLEELTKGRHV